VFVSNIPYSFGEDDILKAFEGLKITKVRVMRTSMGKSRGFCFIDLADHGEQQKALQEIPTKEINGRNPSCRVSKVDPKKSEVCFKWTTQGDHAAR
jgi:RNA recognition motif-containing protein